MGEKAIKGKAITKVLSCLVVFAILMSVFSVAVIATDSANSTASNVNLNLNDEANSSVENLNICSNTINETETAVNESANLANESASGGNKALISGSQSRTGDLTVYVYNINLNPLPASGGQITVILKHDYYPYDEVERQTKDFEGGDYLVHVTFHDIPISEVIPNRHYQYYTIDVFEQPNSDYTAAAECWGSCQRINIERR